MRSGLAVARRTGTSLSTLLLMVVLFGGLPPAAASEAPQSTGSSAEAGGTTTSENPEKQIRKAPFGVTLESDATTNAFAFWVWSAGRRGFSLTDYVLNWGSYGGIASYDLDTGKRLAEVQLNPRIHRPGTMASGQEHFGAVDDAGGRLFVAYETGAVQAWNHTVTPASSGQAPSAVSDGAQQRVCTSTDNTDIKNCVGGVYVLDAATLDVQRKVPLRQIMVDGAPTAPVLRAMSYNPPRGPRDAGKLLLIVEDVTQHPIEANQSPRYRAPNQIFAVQLDPETGDQDWVLRLTNCRGVREPEEDSLIASAKGLPHPAAIFRSPDPERNLVWAVCHNTGQTVVVNRIELDAQGKPSVLPYQPTGDPAGVLADQTETAQDPGPRALLIEGGRVDVTVGPTKAFEVYADPASERILMAVIDGSPLSQVMWVFDGLRNEFVGTVGLGRYGHGKVRYGLNPLTGRLYGMAAPDAAKGVTGGLYVADMRRSPLPQALVYSHVTVLPDAVVAVDPGDDTRPTRLFARRAGVYEVYEDYLPATADPVVEEFAGRTLDLDEGEGVTSTVFDAAARGYGARALMVGGLEAALRAGQADPGNVESLQKDLAILKPGGDLASVGTLLGFPVYSQCLTTDRELVLGFIGPRQPAVVDANGSRGGAEPIVMDSGLRADMEKPYSRCSLLGDWDETFSTGDLISNPPVQDPRVGQPLGETQIECISSSEDPSAQYGDPIAGQFAAQVDCGQEEAEGYAYARGGSAQDLATVAEALSSFRIYRDPGRGVVARVESVARGVTLDGVVRIDSIRGVAESWANGRRQLVDAADRATGYDPNCDFDRTAGSCFQRALVGVRTPVYSCGPCGDEREAVDAISRALGSNSRVRLRQPDPRLAKGAENGFLAAVQKPDSERFSDLVLNNDNLQTVVPVLEVIRFAPPFQPLGGGRRGRQVYQFAGVEVSSSYGIQCLLVYDKDTGTCAAAKEPPGSITVALADADGRPLAGGAFAVRRDTDGDGVAGLKDVLLSGGACVTAADGVGTCTFTDLAPGGYLVAQVAAPAGFGKISEPFTVELASGEARTVTFTNTTNVSVVQVKATDEAGKPVSGAVFAVFADPDADGKVTGGATPAATCTTAADGMCTMSVPAGSYVLVQTAAPAGLEVIDPVAFTLASAGQTAAVGVTNYPAGYPAGVPAPPPAAGPAPVYRDAAPAPVTETVGTSMPPPLAQDATAPRASLPEAVSGTIVRVIAAPGDTLRLLARSPKEALAWIASLALFTAAALAVLRRRALQALS